MARMKQAVPTESPLEAGNLICGACGSVMEPKAVMGPRNVEAVKYACKNEETGCNYEVSRKVPVQNSTMKGVKAEPVKA